MQKTVEFYYDFGSPTSYLAFRQLPALCEKHGAQIDYKPVLLGGIFKATGNNTPVAVPAKGRYMLTDMQRFAERHNVKMRMNPHFPINTLGVMRGAFAAMTMDKLAPYNSAVFDAIWTAEKNMGDPEVIRAVLDDAGLPGEELLERAQTDMVKTALKDATAAAVDRGLFGCPTLFVGDQMFFGQDRMDFVAQALSASAEALPRK